MHEVDLLRAKKNARARQVLAALGALLPMLALTAWMYGLRDSAPGLSEFFLGPLLVGGGMIFWLLFLHLGVCRGSPAALGLGRGRPWQGLAIGVGLGLAFLALKILTDPWLRALFPPRPPSHEIIQLIQGVAADPVLLALWLGPVVWIGVAGFEELWRVFMLNRAWFFLPGRWGRWAGVFLVSALIGAAHAYQGPGAALSLGFKSMLMGAYFMYTRRLWPLIVAHAVYDSVQIVMAVLALNGVSR